MPPWDGSASLFPQASDVGSTGCCPLANRIASGAAGPIVSAIGGVALPMAFTIHGAAINSPSLVVVSSSPVSGGRVCAQQGCSAPELASDE